MKIVTVELIDGKKIKRFSVDGIELKKGDYCVVPSIYGEELGLVVDENPEIQQRWLKVPLEKVIRKATDEDVKFFFKKLEREKEAFEFCRRRIEHRALPMKLVKVNFFTNERKVIFYFTAEGRIDFRDLVKDLAKKYKMRIEMRQIGIRDEARMMGGVGVCGRFLCCMTFLKEFRPVSISLAKQQELNINPSKISGLCGRLMCCLSYEVEGELQFNLSDIGQEEE